jgi:LPS export ABC transporter protein LptC
MRDQKSWTRRLSLIAIIAALAACRSQTQTTQPTDNGSPAQIDTSLAFNNVTLEQADSQGRKLWKVRGAEAHYSPDQQVAEVKSPSGQLYEDGKPVYRFQAKAGEILRSGERIVLRGEVITTDTQNGAVLRSDRLEWRPKQGLLLLQGNLRGSHDKLRVSANEGKFQQRQQQAEISGNVIAFTTNPKLLLQTEHVIWQIKAAKVLADQPVQVQRLEGDQATDQATANQAEVDLTKKTVHLQQNANLIVREPPLQISGPSLIWDANKQTLIADQPFSTTERQQQITVTADRGRMELQPRIAYFNGNVQAIASRNQSHLTSNDLTWKITSQEVTALGNVVYIQPDPPATLRGAKAVGKLQNQTVVVTGGESGSRVVTEIVPKQTPSPGG